MISIGGKDRPVLRLGKRLFAGEQLSIVNPAGYGGRVWSGMDLDHLKFNAAFARGKQHGDFSGPVELPKSKGDVEPGDTGEGEER